MIRKLALLAMIGATAAQAQAPAALSAPPLKAASKWTLDYGRTQCAAGRDFGQGNDLATLVIRPAPNGETYELLVATSGSGPQFADQSQGLVNFGSQPIKTWALRYRTDDKRKVLHTYRLTKKQMAQARSAKFVSFDLKGRPLAAVQLSSMSAILDGLEQCTADLKYYWNMGGEADGRVVQPPRADMRDLFRASDFPQEALDRNQEGTAQFVLLVDEQGKVAGCHVQVTSGVPALDVGSCQVIRARAKFEPARDRNGKPVRSTVMTPPITYRYG